MLDIPSPRTEDMEDGKVKYVFCPISHYSALLHNLIVMKRDQVLTDATLMAKDGECFHFHAILLAACGSEFHRIFCSTKMHWFRGELVMIDTPADVLSALATFVYSPDVLFSHPDNWKELLDFASSYGLEHMVHSEGDIQKMVANIQDMYENHLMTYTLVRAGKMELWAHSAILVASSPAFKSWMMPNYLPARSDVVDIENISADIMEMFLTYVYYAHIDIDMTVVDKLLLAACELVYPSVGKACCDFLVKKTSKFNVIWVLNLAQQAYQISHDEYCQGLWDDTKRFIIKNFGDVVIDGKFEDIQTTEEVIEFITCADLTAVMTKDVIEAVVCWCNTDPDTRLLKSLSIFACLSMLIDTQGLTSATRIMANFTNINLICDTLFPNDENGDDDDDNGNHTEYSEDHPIGYQHNNVEETKSKFHGDQQPNPVKNTEIKQEPRDTSRDAQRATENLTTDNEKARQARNITSINTQQNQDVSSTTLQAWNINVKEGVSPTLMGTLEVGRGNIAREVLDISKSSSVKTVISPPSLQAAGNQVQSEAMPYQRSNGVFQPTAAHQNESVWPNISDIGVQNP